ncbi:ABC transporter permease [Candidatus Woesebacteria bacterium]|nr:MAG: ABC transporter permease [Candidatus Woesebacteria bacterium]
MNFNFRVAWRFLTFNKLQTLFISIGIGVGVTVQMFVGLLIDSLQTNLIDQTVGRSAHITVIAEKEKEYIKNSDNILELIKPIEGIKIAQKVVEGSVLAIGSDDSKRVIFKGVELINNDIFGISESLVEGSLPTTQSEVLVGTQLAQTLNLKLGDRIFLDDVSQAGGGFRISGIFDIGNSAINENWIAADVETVQNFFGLRKYINQIAIQVDDIFAADTLALTIDQTIKEESIKVTNWKDENRDFLSALSSQTASSFMIQFFVLVSVIIAITSILSITVMQKQRQLGILKAMGIKDSDSMSIFIIESFAIGLLGSTLGIAGGFGLFLGFINGTKLFEPTVRWTYVAGTYLLTVVASTLAGYIPARKSANLNPIDIIQNE